MLRLPALADRLWDISELYKTGTLALVEAPSFSADFDEDGDVDGDDYLAWQRGFGSAGTGSLASGDANNDTNVDGADFAIWVGQFGDAGLVAAVPEPGTAALAAWASVMGIAYARRKLQS